MTKLQTTRALLKHFVFGTILSLSSFSGVVYFFVVARQDFPFLHKGLLGVDGDAFLLRNFLYIAFFAGFAFLTLKLTPLIYSGVETLEIKEEKPIESIAVPTYIGLFVIAIGLQQLDQNIGYIVLVVLFMFWRRLEKIFYFNPIWLFFGYRFYEVRSDQNNTYTLITKRSKLKGSYNFAGLRRINDYTYLEER
jgi:hypothetical protein